MDVERLVVRLIADSLQYDRVMNRIERDLSGMAGRFTGLGRAIEIPMIAAAGSVAALGFALTAGAVASLRLAASFETTSIALEVMTGSMEKGKKLVTDITQLAIETPFKVSDLMEVSKSLLAFGFSSEQIIPTLRTLGDVAAGTGTDIQRIVLAAGQIKVAGRLMGPELRQLIDAGVPMFDYLAKVMDQPVQRIKGMVEEGKISWPKVVEAFNLMTKEGGTFFNLMERQSQTTQGRWNAFVETLQLGARNVGLSFFEAFGVRGALDEWQARMGDMTRDGTALEFFKEMRDHLTTIWSLIKTAAYWTGELWKWLKNVIEQNAGLIKTVAVIYGVIYVVNLLAAAWAMATFAVTAFWAALLTPVGFATVAIIGLIAVMHQLGDLETIGDGAVHAFNELFQIIKDIGPALKDALDMGDQELAGELIGKTFKLAWSTFITTMKVEFLDFIGTLASRIATEFEALTKKLVAQGKFFLGLLDPTQKNEDVERKYFERIKEIDAAQKAKHDENKAALAAAKTKEINETIAPIKAEIDAIKTLIEERKKLRNLPPALRDWMNDAAPIMKGIQERAEQDLKAWNEADRGFFYRLIYNPLVEQFKKEGKPEEVAKELADKHAQAALEAHRAKLLEEFKVQQKTIVDNLMFPAWSIAAGMMGTKVPHTGPGSAPFPGMEVPLGLRSEVVLMANDLRREMGKELHKGIGVGGGQYEHFLQQMDLLREARFGPLANVKPSGNPIMDASLGMLQGMTEGMKVIDDAEFQFGVQREYLNLQRWVHKGGEVKLPPAAMFGTAEAQDIVNRSAVQRINIEADILTVLQDSKRLQQEQLDEQRKTAQGVLGLIGPGAAGGGGDF